MCQHNAGDSQGERKEAKEDERNREKEAESERDKESERQFL